MPNHTISFCTVAMNRTEHIRETLPQNLRDNASYEGLTFVLLDYNSTDGLEAYVRLELGDYLDNGRLLYYRFEEALHFRRAHSRNMAILQAPGDIVCNIDADNYTGKDFAGYVDRTFSEQGRICLNALGSGKVVSKKDVLGRICMWKGDFLAIGGFDEQMECYGFEDHDLIYRLEMIGVRSILVDNPAYLTAIEHGDLERIGQEAILKDIQAVLLRHIDPNASEFIFLFNGGVLGGGVVHDMKAKSATLEAALRNYSPRFEMELDGNIWKKGVWSVENGGFLMRYEEGELLNPAAYQQVRSRLKIQDMVLFYGSVTNRHRMEETLRQKRSKANGEIFGAGNVKKIGYA